jgi:hypothetical protein
MVMAREDAIVIVNVMARVDVAVMGECQCGSVCNSEGDGECDGHGDGEGDGDADDG